jgi:hypothetical protein
VSLHHRRLIDPQGPVVMKIALLDTASTVSPRCSWASYSNYSASWECP